MTTTVPKRADAAADPAERAPRGVLMTVLVLSGLFTLAVEVLYLPLYLGRSGVPAPEPAVVAAGLAVAGTGGATPFPITALVAAVLNVLLVAAMGTLTSRLRIMLLPLLAWAFGFFLCSIPGPGGDLMLLSDWPTLVLLLGGTIPPLLYAVFRWNPVRE
ncbi:hypothetical protein [Nocardia goodfellowii]|uniref:Uncharacterized protein n=1 Tax=Nocardia goodfellowii TaxID=882446 RepID=A0ABS4QDL7_9NOCA|nr:hypothetical protein [Nocardia goodfellowii]MBP2189260.1 hypothetical protein [Nocardia goodfellowii]